MAAQLYRVCVPIELSVCACVWLLWNSISLYSMHSAFSSLVLSSPNYLSPSWRRFLFLLSLSCSRNTLRSLVTWTTAWWCDNSFIHVVWMSKAFLPSPRTRSTLTQRSEKKKQQPNNRLRSNRNVNKASNATAEEKKYEEKVREEREDGEGVNYMRKTFTRGTCRTIFENAIFSLSLPSSHAFMQHWHRSGQSGIRNTRTYRTRSAVYDRIVWLMLNLLISICFGNKFIILFAINIFQRWKNASSRAQKLCMATTEEKANWK